MTAAIVCALGSLAAIIVNRTPGQWRREGLYQAAATAHLRDAIVVVRAQYPTRYARNGAFFDDDVLFLSAPPDVDAATIHAAYPGKAIWEAHEPQLGAPWALVRRY